MVERRPVDDLLVGVEEEFLLVDVETGRPAPRIAGIIGDAQRLAGDQAQQELHQVQIESATSPAATLGELRAGLVDLRRKLVEAAGQHGCQVVASGAYPANMGASGRLITAEDRYQSMAEANSVLAREQLICGCHVHVSTPDPERAIVVMNRLRRWLSYLLALSANSPYWENEDTGFASFRTEVWSRWPTAGPPGDFESSAQYEQLLEQLIGAGVILDSGMAYWDVRPSQRFPTLEIRVADVMPTVDNVVAVAGMARALVAFCDSEEGRPPPLRPELLRAASWRAARTGLAETLIDPLDGSVRPARQALDELLHELEPALEQLGDAEEVRSLVGKVFDEGSGSHRQRLAFGRNRTMADVLRSVTIGPDGDAPDCQA